MLDEAGDFEAKCNLAMIDLAPVAAEEEVMRRLANQGGDLESHGLVDVMADMTGQDAERLHALITRHAHYTNSAKAKTILADWKAWAPKFKKIMPVEYREALKKMAEHQSTTPPASTRSRSACQRQKARREGGGVNCSLSPHFEGRGLG